MKIRFKLNGKWVETETSPPERALDVLRDRLGVISVKEGCGEGECGACSILYNGRQVLSCLLPATQLEGAEVWTAEGLQDTEVFEAFLESDALQCGFCTPGFLVAAHAYVLQGGSAEPQAIREALAGNLCRCTGYLHIVQAIRKALRKRHAAHSPE